jgi:para-aminobenzoate synthetase/4-amino-4-deoxychorismate lyase
MEIIHELEATPREIYTGAVGYRSPVAGLELNVAIRTFEFCAGRMWLGTGGGIVADSLDDDEYRECLFKAGPLIRAVGGQLGSEYSSHADEAPSRLGAVRSSMRPRPASGVFTSLLVTAGATRDLADHVTRLEASARELFGKHLPASLHDDLAACLAMHPSGRLRITARPVGGPLQASVEVVPLDDRPAAVGLQPAVVARGLGPHKWLDRRLLAEIARHKLLGADEQLLIQDTDEGVLETDRANIFAVVAGILRTPPSDRRILPGVTRAAVLHIAHLQGVTVDVAPMTRAQLAEASEVFVTNAVCGVLPVKSIAGRPVTSVAGPVTRRIAACLAERPASDGHTAPAGQVPDRPATAMALRRLVKPAIVLIDNYDSFTYNLAHMLLVNGCLVEVVRNDEVSAEQVAAFCPAGVVISPGPCAPADAGISMEVVRACGSTTPLLGICLGHQVIAAAFGATIVRAPWPVHGRTSMIVHDSRGIFTGLPQRFEAARYHSLMVKEDSLPAFLTVAARTREQIPMALRHVTRPIEGVQFHPESILTAHGARIMRNFVVVIGRRGPTGPGSAHLGQEVRPEVCIPAGGGFSDRGAVDNGCPRLPA